MRKRAAASIVCALAICAAVLLCACSQKYVSEAKAPTVDPPAVSTAGVLRVGVDASSYPFAGQSKGGINGIDVDVAAALADEMGLKLELVDIGMNGATALGNGTVDLVMGLDASKTSPEQCWTSDAYLDSCIVLFSTAPGASAPTRSSSPVIGAQTSSLSAYLVSQLYGANALKAYDELKAVFQGLEQGEVGNAASDAVVGSYVVGSLGMDASIVALMEEPSGYCIGVAASNTPLQLAVTQSLSAIEGNGVLEVIMLKWLGRDIDLADVPLAEPAQEALDRARQEAEEAERAAADEAAAEEGQRAGEDAASGGIEVGANAVSYEG